MLMNCERKNMIFLGMLPVAIYCEAFQESLFQNFYDCIVPLFVSSFAVEIHCRQNLKVVGEVHLLNSV